MKPQTVNMFFGLYTFIGQELLDSCKDNNINPVILMALLYRKHGRTAILGQDFAYFGDKKYRHIGEAIKEFDQNDFEIRQTDIDFVCRFIEKMEGTKIEVPQIAKPEPEIEPVPEVEIKPEPKPEPKKKKSWFKTVAKLFAGIAGFISFASFFVPSLKPIAEILKKISSFISGIEF